jgi:hypothetical protein
VEFVVDKAALGRFLCGTSISLAFTDSTLIIIHYHAGAGSDRNNSVLGSTSPKKVKKKVSNN